MPTTSVEKLSPTRAKLTISVTPDELKPSIAHAYEHIAEQINVPGFRKGKVPPPIIDQRVGKAAVLEHAVNEGLDGFYRAAVTEHELRPLGRPEADIVEWPNEKDFSGDLLLAIEVDVRPEIELPDYDGLELTVDSVEIGDDEVTEELDRLRSRFGTLITVDRPATTGDFVTLDLVAIIDDTEVDTASGISYELGSGELLEGIDEALESLTAGETTTFESKLLGGDHEGETAEITVTVTAVKERELPAADDDFAQIASEFDTLDELTADLRTRLGRVREMEQLTAARDKVLDALVDATDVPLPEGIVKSELDARVHDAIHPFDHDEEKFAEFLEENGKTREEFDTEAREDAEKSVRVRLVLDKLADDQEVTVSQDELTERIVFQAQQYQMPPEEFVKRIQEAGQLGAIYADVRRSTALNAAVRAATVTDPPGELM